MTLHAKLARLAWRMKALSFVRWLSLCLFWAFCLAILVAGLDKLAYLGVDVYVVGGLIVAAAFPAALLLARLRENVGVLRAAMEADRVLDLGDRLGSAVELARADGPWADAVVRDAGRCVQDMRAAEVFPFTPTLAVRLLIPAVIVLSLVLILPPADLLGRMDREAGRRAAAEVDAERSEAAIAAALGQCRRHGVPLPGGAGGLGAEKQPRSLGNLRLAFFKMQKKLKAGEMDGKARLELSERLRKLAALMAEEGAGARLSESIKKAADALGKDPEKAADLLRAVQAELARLEDALNDPKLMDRYMKRLADAKRAALRGADSQDLAGRREPKAAAGSDEDLVELAAVGKEPGVPVDSGGIIYLRGATGSRPAEAAADYEQAARFAHAQIESGAIPAAYARLVRGYFSSIKPAEK